MTPHSRSRAKAVGDEMANRGAIGTPFRFPDRMVLRCARITWTGLPGLRGTGPAGVLPALGRWLKQGRGVAWAHRGGRRPLLRGPGGDEPRPPHGRLFTRGRGPATAPPPGRPTLQKVWHVRWCYLFMLPSLGLAALFTFYPVVAAWYMSLLDWSGLTAERTFVGLANYREAVTDPYFWRAFGRTFLFAAVDVPITLFLSLLIAIILNDQTIRLRSVFRTLIFLPVVTTTAIVGVVMSLILNPFDGPVNLALLESGLIDRPVDFLGSPDTALWSVLGVHVWKWLGISMIYWLVALQTVPRELYEAAEVDGAGWWRKHRSITGPIILPFAVVISLITVVGTLQVFPLVQAMTQGGPNFSTELVELYIYRLAFTAGQPRLGYASAVAVFFGLTVMLLAVTQAWAARRTRAFRRELEER